MVSERARKSRHCPGHPTGGRASNDQRQAAESEPGHVYRDSREGVGAGWQPIHAYCRQEKFRASSSTTLIAQLLAQPCFGEDSGYCRVWASCPGHCYPLPATCLSLMFIFFHIYCSNFEFLPSREALQGARIRIKALIKKHKAP